MAQHKSLLPKIPGFHQSYMEIKDKYPIGTDLEVINDVRFIKSIERKDDKVRICDEDVAMVMLAKGLDAINKRTWMIFDKEVLTFDAYYKTAVFASFGRINYNVRKLKIIYFLVDDTIQVNEPTEHNSGMPQGCLLKRQKIPLPGCRQDAGPYFKLTDLVVGGTVDFYGKVLTITGVDGYTKDFLYKMGVDVMENQSIPEDPYFAYRKQAELDVVPKIKSINIRNRTANDLEGYVLRFRGYWDNRYTFGGELHFFDVLYYLVDDTMELLEEFDDETKAGEVSHKTFVKRQKLPKKGPWCTLPGQNVKQEILNVIQNDTNEYYYKMDSRLLSDKDILPYYHCTDLYIGATLNVYNRFVTLVKCDEFTKQFYAYEYGLEKFNEIAAPKTLKDIQQEELNQKKQEIILKNQDEDLRKMLLKNGGTGMVFGFIIKMVTNDPVNAQRKFMLKYYLDDTEFAVYEFRETNSGLRGGMFRSKRKFNDNDKHLFVFHQLAVGVTIFVNNFQFIITDADDKTVKYMIDNPTEFQHSDVAALSKKTRKLIDDRYQSLDEFRTKHFQDRQLVGRDEFRRVMSFDEQLNPHVGVVFALVHKRPDPFETVSEKVFRSVIQDTLRRARFIHFNGLQGNFRRRKSQSDREGHIGRTEWFKAMKSNKVPLTWEVTNMLLDKFTDAEHGDVNYEDMVKFMDYITDPAEDPNGLAEELLFVKPSEVFVKVDEFVDGLRTKA